MDREDGELQLRGDEPLVQGGGHEAQGGLERGTTDIHVLAEPRRFQAPEVEGRALPLATARKGDDGPVAGPDELLELDLRFGERPGGGVGGLRAQLDLLI